MMLDKEREAERLAKVYKETNKEREEWRALVQRQGEKNKRRRQWLSFKNIHASGWQDMFI